MKLLDYQNTDQKKACKWFFTDSNTTFEHFIWLINISTTTYEVQKFISYICLQDFLGGGGRAGLTSPTPSPIDTEFRRLCE